MAGFAPGQIVLVDWRDAAWGGLLAALAFEVAKRLFAIFIARFPTYTMIYGALAAMPIFLVWVYLSWLITLVGAVLAAALPIVKYERWWHVPVPGSVFVDAGQIWATGNLPAGENQAFPSSQAFRFSTGVGATWSSPIGPLKFSYAIPFANKPYDRLQKFQFTAGTTF